MASHNALGSPDSNTIAWIAALPIELAAAEAMLDEEHAVPTGFTRHQTDSNVYTWGRVGEHNMAIASLAPESTEPPLLRPRPRACLPLYHPSVLDFWWA
jgi:hypothetical protein